VEDGNRKPKKRFSPWILGAFVLISLTILILLQTSNLWKDLTVDSARDTLLLYALSSLNFVALIIFGFILLRNLLKLARERRALELGAKFKTRLWLYFFAVSLLPILAMAFFSSLFLNRALQNWFTEIPKEVARASLKVKNSAVADQHQKFQEAAQMLVATLENKPFDDNDLRKIAEAGNLTRLEVTAKNGKSLAVFEKNLDAPEKEQLETTLVLIRSGEFGAPVLHDGKGFDAAFAQFADGRRLFIVPDLLADENVSQMVDNALIEFDKLKNRQSEVRQIGFLTLGVLTFLLIFASSWTAFYIARGLTVPIKALAKGADEIARGKLGHRVEVLAEDELALLVKAFNEMSAKLEENSAELEERRRYIETVLQSLSTGVISFDAENRVTTINQAAVQILKLETGDFTGFELKQLMNEENRQTLERLLNRAKRIGQASEQTVMQPENVDGNGSGHENKPVALTATALPQNFGAASGVVVVIEDLSELISAQRASAWAEVARRMAHEIKNPLTPIQLSAERISKNFHKNAAENGNQIQNPKSKIQKVVDESTATILREVHSLKSMVDEFSQFARLPNVRLETGNLNEIICQSAALYEDREAKIELNLAENLPNAMIDEEQLKRVFVNLIENAVEAFDADQTEKRISVKTFYDRARDIIVAEIADNGKGIAPQDLQKLFQPYFSTKGRGTGLGLAIVQRIVSEHRGKIKAVNNSPKGAKFIVELPVVV
jgi:PAS domain S-box-containing protein